MNWYNIKLLIYIVLFFSQFNVKILSQYIDSISCQLKNNHFKLNYIVCKLVLQTLVSVIMAFFYIALFYVQYILKALHTLLPNQACVILHIYSFSISTLEYTVPIAADYRRSGYYHRQYKLTNVRYKRLGLACSGCCPQFLGLRPCDWCQHPLH